MSDCLFCKIAAGEIPAKIEYEDDDLVAFHDIDPQAPVHLLVIPRRHIATLLEAEGDEETAILGRMQRVAIDLARRLGLDEDGFRLVINCLEGGGQAVFHIHLHLLGGRSMGWPPG